MVNKKKIKFILNWMVVVVLMATICVYKGKEQ